MTITVGTLIILVACMLFFLYLWWDCVKKEKELEEKIDAARQLMQQVTDMNDAVIDEDRNMVEDFSEKWKKIVSVVEELTNTFDAYVNNTDKRIESICKASSLYEQEYERKCNDLNKEIAKKYEELNRERIESYTSIALDIRKLTERLGKCEETFENASFHNAILQNDYPRGSNVHEEQGTF